MYKPKRRLNLQFFGTDAPTSPKDYMEKAQKAWHHAKEIMDDYEGKEIPQDKEEQIDRLFDDVEKYQQRADRMQKMTDIGDDLDKKIHQPQRKHAFGAMETKEEKEKRQKAEHKQLFEKYYRGGKSALEPEERKTLSSLSDPEGGVLVPEEFRAELIRKRRDLVQMRQFATVLQTQSQSVGFPVFDFDGDAQWTSENTEILEEDITNAFGKQQFVPSKLARIFRMPNELIEDSAINVESLMTDHFATRFGEIEENAFINGDGVNKPLGLLSAGLPEFTATDTGGTFQADDIFDIVYNLRAVYRSGGSFMFHRNAIRRIRKFKDADGNYLWEPAIQAGEPNRLLGFPVIESEFFPDNVDTGSSGDPLGIFGDFSFYWIVDRTDISIQRLIERYAEFDQIGFRLRLRVDGSPVWDDPFQVLVRGT